MAMNELLERWRSELGAQAHQFHPDGIIDPDLFAKAATKVLFLCKEPNNHEGEGFDFREEWRDQLKYRFAHRLEQWAEGLLNDFPPFEEMKASSSVALRSVAFMNVKKTGGRSFSEKADILDHAKRFKHHLLDQIRQIDPQIIVGSLSWWSVYEALFGAEATKDREVIEDMWVFKHGRAVVIDFYHPSNRYPSSMQYALLSRVVGSERFKAL